MNSNLLKQLANIMAAGIPVEVKMVNGDIIQLKNELEVIGEDANIIDSEAGLQANVTQAAKYRFKQE